MSPSLSLRGWKGILLRTQKQVVEDNIGIVAAGTAFYALLSVPFFLTAMVFLYGLVADPADVQRHMNELGGFLPGEFHALIADQLTRLSTRAGGGLTFAFVGSLLIALWSGSGAIKALFVALNIAYGEREKRKFVRLNLLALGLTLASVVGVLVALTLVVGVPAAIDRLGLSETGEIVGSVARWPILGGLALLAMACIYRYGPSRSKAQWRWVTWGSAFATGLWIAGSALFSWYVSSFARYNQAYGSLGAVVIALMWFYLSSFILMLGAELDSEMEHQTRRDTGKKDAA